MWLGIIHGLLTPGFKRLSVLVQPLMYLFLTVTRSWFFITFRYLYVSVGREEAAAEATSLGWVRILDPTSTKIQTELHKLRRKILQFQTSI